MKKLIFEGAATALVTPFTEDGLNFDAMGKLIDHQIANQIDALVICGTTGETSTMTVEEDLEIIRYSIQKINGRVPAIAGAGSNETKKAIQISQMCEEAGADALLHVTPYYNKTTQEGLYRHFRMIAESVSLPIIVYNVPGRTGLNIDPPTAKRLSEIDNIAAIKECNLNQVGEVARLCGDGLTIYSGDDDKVLPMMAYGGKGVISVLSNIIPKDTHEMAASFLKGDIETCRRLQLRFMPLINALFCEVNPIPVKTALNLMGFEAGPLRMPLCPMSEKNLSLLKQAMSDYGLL
ncbi:MAG: 4-hydroxy-tetrahydrodipicolinate synthase [Peptococcaceae bacterium]|nr:4-hydroxy-tetrahydrodipicolinate synthase [Peptococcaceae bacterium]